jgi:hypothetical protein
MYILSYNCEKNKKKQQVKNHNRKQNVKKKAETR